MLQDLWCWSNFICWNIRNQGDEKLPHPVNYEIIVIKIIYHQKKWFSLVGGAKTIIITFNIILTCYVDAGRRLKGLLNIGHDSL